MRLVIRDEQVDHESQINLRNNMWNVEAASLCRSYFRTICFRSSTHSGAIRPYHYYVGVLVTLNKVELSGSFVENLNHFRNNCYICYCYLKRTSYDRLVIL